MNKPDKKVILFLMTEKGLRVLNRIIADFTSERISFVVTCKDPAVDNDFHSDIVETCSKNNIEVYTKLPQKIATENELYIAISWRTLIPISDGKRLVVFHDSLLPRYRGFNPLVSALINGETTIGATALIADEKYDRGKILLQKSAKIEYPIKIQTAIQRIAGIYEELATDIVSNFLSGKKMEEIEQNEENATYSIWRDEEDYKIDWHFDAKRILRQIDAVGYPYKGASTTLEQKTVRIMSAEAVDSLLFENNSPGKIFEIEGGYPIVLCGRGQLKITDLRDEYGQSLLPLKKLKLRFGAK
ncbi:hypothetical protein AZI85_15970 [Bdellovibrio bacteriovorus]|uniref:Uncharacterized protein n=1 Tax=Bdellovibrio bacteriovorus TaxID=959 RepID=A0A150WTR3_BDEBC|nr:formyltransferase family protein [Bdellovibrio bacteriovorus]KYG69889.1 hypothetical protein AZI85_15970 [Bdellovibrio bacteriovorus]